MAALDNLVVTFALPTIRKDLHATIQQLEWTVNAYTLTFAVLLMTGAALGDRFGRRRVFIIGLSIFTASSAWAALSTNAHELIAARAVQGVGGAIVLPLTLTLLSEAFPEEKRGLAIGAFAGISGLAIAIGPLVGGAIVSGISWEWIFWINVPIGLVTLPLARWRLNESQGPDRRLDLLGNLLLSVGLFGIVYGVIRASDIGWGTAEVGLWLAGGVIVTVLFVLWEFRTEAPMLPMRLFRSRGFTVINTVTLVMFFGMFGSIFLLSQYMQNVLGYSAFQAGLRTLPWTAMPAIVSPIAGIISEKTGGRGVVILGMALQAVALAYLALVVGPNVSYLKLVPPFLLAGAGMAMVFPPLSLIVLNSVRKEEEGKASGANNAIRELGGVFGIAVLATIFVTYGGYASPRMSRLAGQQLFVDGLKPAAWVGSALVALGTVIAVALPRMRNEKVATIPAAVAQK
jgi:EmrB/QacA subfamily drug resistance transporter